MSKSSVAVAWKSQQVQAHERVEDFFTESFHFKRQIARLYIGCLAEAVRFRCPGRHRNVLVLESTTVGQLEWKVVRAGIKRRHLNSSFTGRRRRVCTFRHAKQDSSYISKILISLFDINANTLVSLNIDTPCTLDSSGPKGPPRPQGPQSL